MHHIKLIKPLVISVRDRFEKQQLNLLSLQLYFQSHQSMSSAQQDDLQDTEGLASLMPSL